MVDFNKLLIQEKIINEQEIFVGYCRVCDIKSKIYESNIIKLDDNNDKDLFKCTRCKVCQERNEIIPF